jgi:hypothetical protein
MQAWLHGLAGTRAMGSLARHDEQSTAIARANPVRGCRPCVGSPSVGIDSRFPMNRLARNWVYGGFLAGILLLVLAPAICRGWSIAMILIFLQLPIYMLHQLEEHDADRFRIFFNQTIGHGREVLTPAAVFVINVPGVWGVNALSILLATFVQTGWGLIGVFLTLVNALVHIAQAIRMRKYNPGLVTAVVLFLPVGGAGLWAIVSAGLAMPVQLGVALASAVAIHAGIIVYAKRRMARI